jgi:hypothetical protein
MLRSFRQKTRGFCAKRIGSFAIPRQIRLVAPAYHRNATFGNHIGIRRRSENDSAILIYNTIDCRLEFFVNRLASSALNSRKIGMLKRF